MATPLKLNASNAGDLKEMTTTEEQHLAYRAGLHMAASDDDDVGALDNGSGGTTVGTYSNTFYNQAIGTHPGSSLSVGTTNTSLYQNTGETAAYTDGDFHRPVKQDSGNNVKEFTDAEMNTIVDRLNTYRVTNQLPGSYYLASSAPSSDWDTHLSNIFVDTQASNGSTINYSIYQRQSITAPDTYRPIKVRDGDGNLEEMTNDEMQVTFGQWMKTRSSIAGGIGAYQLRNSGAGAPTDTGTWQARGTATDTRKTTGDVSYSAAYSADYSGAYTNNFTQNFTGNFTGAYTGNYVGNYTGNYIGNYVNPNANARPGTAGNYRFVAATPSLSYSYTGIYNVTYYGPQSYSDTYSATYSATYSGAYSGSYTSVYTGDFVGNFTGAYTGNYTGNYAGETISNSNATIETYTLYVRVS